VTIRVESSPDTEWVSITVQDRDREPATVAINRAALEAVVAEDPRPPELLLDLLARRAIKRMPVPNGGDVRLITHYNLSLVWPE